MKYLLVLLFCASSFGMIGPFPGNTGGGSGGTPGGSVTSIQYNNSGAFGGFGSWDGSTFTVPGNATITGTGTVNVSLISDNTMFLNLDTPGGNDYINFMVAGTNNAQFGLQLNGNPPFNGDQTYFIYDNLASQYILQIDLTNPLTLLPTRVLVNGSSDDGSSALQVNGNGKFTGSVTPGNLNTGSNVGTPLCSDANGAICTCGSCN